MEKIVIFWFRRDLRLADNAGLYHALKSGYKVLPVFIFDSDILDKLADKTDRRVQFIHHSLKDIQLQLNSIGSDLKVFFGKPETIFLELFNQNHIASIYCNYDYEKYANIRDSKIETIAKANNAHFCSFKDQAFFDKNEILSNSQTPYTVFTPYKNKWKEKLNDYYTKAYPTEKYFEHFIQTKPEPIIALSEMGFEATENLFPAKETTLSIVKNYAENRDFPEKMGTSRLSVHLRFGTVSIRSLVKKAIPVSDVWLNELIWRDFYFNVLHHFPHISDGLSFKKQYEQIEWRNNPDEFKSWCKGKTGYPIVDAGMRELNQTGFMHNRVRMIVASFLTKHLLIDWRWGEAYFAEKLLDFDFSANNGGWQWASGSGCDAAPYFRVFNPTLQTQKFDKNLVYIKKWVPEFGTTHYPQPIVNHEFARKRVLEAYQKALKTM